MSNKRPQILMPLALVSAGLVTGFALGWVVGRDSAPGPGITATAGVQVSKPAPVVAPPPDTPGDAAAAVAEPAAGEAAPANAAVAAVVPGEPPPAPEPARPADPDWSGAWSSELSRSGFSSRARQVIESCVNPSVELLTIECSEPPCYLAVTTGEEVGDAWLSTWLSTCPAWTEVYQVGVDASTRCTRKTACDLEQAYMVALTTPQYAAQLLGSGFTDAELGIRQQARCDAMASTVACK